MAGIEASTLFDDLLLIIAGSALDRERSGDRPVQAVQSLNHIGLGSVRFRSFEGEAGLSLGEFFPLIIRLATADSNIAQIFRAHFAFVEGRLMRPWDEQSDYWLDRISQGDMWGSGTAERTSLNSISSTLTRDETESDSWILNGEKYYCTGSLYADWIATVALDGEDFVSVIVLASEAGVEVHDDWDGFGQITSASGSVKFNNVKIPSHQITHRLKSGQRGTNSYTASFLQLYHLATLVGIGKSCLADAIEYVQNRTRSYGVGGYSEPAKEESLQAIIGRMSALVYGAEAVVKDCAVSMDNLHTLVISKLASDQDFAELDTKVYQAQQLIVDQVLRATGMIFDLGGAHATSLAKGFDRHWRNARTLASHNPVIYREISVGDFLLNGVYPK